jgi:hypothetical protein
MSDSQARIARRRLENVAVIQSCLLDVFPTANVRTLGEDVDKGEWRWRIVGLREGDVRLRVSRLALERHSAMLYVEHLRHNLLEIARQETNRAIRVRDGWPEPVVARDVYGW